MTNRMQIVFSAIPENEGLARMAISAFILPMDPTLEQLSDIKTAVSEAVTNSIIHGYPLGGGEVDLSAEISSEGLLRISVQDQGVGIRDIPLAMQPFFTSERSDERSGMGFTVMQSFMDRVEVLSAPQNGTCVFMEKHLNVLPQELPARMA